MEKYIKPEMEIVELDNMVITASGCDSSYHENNGQPLYHGYFQDESSWNYR